MSCILASQEGNVIEAEVLGVAGQVKNSPYVMNTSSSTAVIEAAAACGLQGLRESKLDPLGATSYGVGQLIFHALDAGASEIVVGLGQPEHSRAKRVPPQRKSRNLKKVCRFGQACCGRRPVAI